MAKTKAKSKEIAKLTTREIATIKKLVVGDKKLSAAFALAARLAKTDAGWRDKANAVARDFVFNRRALGKAIPASGINPKGGKPKANSNTLLQLGVERMTSSRAQILAIIPEPSLNKVLREMEEKDVIQVTPLYKMARALKDKKERDEIEQESKKEKEAEGKVEKLDEKVFGKFKTIYADPPWSYNDSGCSGAAEPVYEGGTMSLDDIQALPVSRLAYPSSCLLWMWTTWPMIRDHAPHDVLDAWGFRWVGEVVWLKPGLGVGRWLRPATEVLILAVKGKPKLTKTDGLKAFLDAPKSKHSTKPDEAYEFIERIAPKPRIELFARRARDGWMRWGDEA